MQLLTDVVRQSHEICFVKSVVAGKGEHYKPEKRKEPHSRKDAAMGTFAQSSEMRAQGFSAICGMREGSAYWIDPTKIKSSKVDMNRRTTF